MNTSRFAFVLGCVCVIAFFSGFVGVSSAKADSIPILTVNGSGGNLDDYIQGEQGPIGPQFTAFSFVLGQQFDDVSIWINNAGIEGPFQAWLTNAIGPATTDENVITEQDFSGIPIPPNITPEEWVAYLSNYPAPYHLFDVDLGPGTYFVTLNGLLCSGNPFDPQTCPEQGYFDWDGTPTTVTSLPDVALGGVYQAVESYVWACGPPINDGPCTLNWSAPYASVWYGGEIGAPGELQIVGTPVPEPSALAIVLVGLSLIFYFRKKLFKPVFHSVS